MWTGGRIQGAEVETTPLSPCPTQHTSVAKVAGLGPDDHAYHQGGVAIILKYICPRTAPHRRGCCVSVRWGLGVGPCSHNVR